MSRRRSDTQKAPSRTRRRRRRGRSPSPPTLAAIGTALHEAHNVRLDGAHDVDLARLGAATIRDGNPDLIDLDADYWVFALIGEVLWNRDHPDEAEAACHAWSALVTAEKRNPGLGHFQSKARDVRSLRQLARALHRKHDPRAWQAITAAHRILCDEAGGWERLSKLIATSPFHGLGELYSELLGIAVPAARRRPSSENNALAELFVRDAITVARQIPLHSRAYTKYHALVAMTLQAVCAQKNPERDRELVDLLWQLDRSTRPQDARGNVTRWVVSAAIAEYFGDLSAARTFRRRADRDLELAEMERHRRVLESHYPIG